MRNVTRPTAVKIAKVFGISTLDDDLKFEDHPYEDRYAHGDYYGPNVWPGEHEESHAKWIVSWESGPHEWALDDKFADLITAATWGKVWGEPVNGFTMALYPNDEEAAQRAVSRLREWKLDYSAPVN